MKTLPSLTALALIVGLSPAFSQTADDGTTTTDETVVVQEDTATPDPDTTDDEDTGEDNGDDTAEDADGADGTEDAAEEEDGGLFSRIIPDGLAKYFNDEEKDDYQARLDAAETPQERNEIRRELQRENQARHLENVQANRDDKQAKSDAKREEKGFFEALSDDVGAIASGDFKNRDARDDRGGGNGDNAKGKPRDKANARDNDRDKRGGGNRGGGNRGGGNGKGRN